MIHELAHASHWELRKRWWNNGRTSDKVIESWARGVQWALTRMVYPNYPGRGNNYPNYTNVVVDMIDDHDAKNEGFENSEGKDGVKGYTIRQIEDVLKDADTWSKWRDLMISRYDNPTEDSLTHLFKQYE